MKEKKPIRWVTLYVAVLSWLAVEIVLFWVFTEVYR